MEGTVTSRPIRMEPNAITFAIKLDKKIKDVPDELAVYSATTTRGYQFLHLREGDKIKIKGEIVKVPLNFWETDHIGIKADRIFNVSLQCGL